MSLINQLKQIPNFRHLRSRRHPLWMILLLTLLGFLCGDRSDRPLADFCPQHESSLRTLIGLPPIQPIPSYSKFQRSALAVEPQKWIGV